VYRAPLEVFGDTRRRPPPAPSATSVSKHKSVVIRIENPVAGGSPYTNLRRANTFISRGMAEWSGPYRIRFVGEAQIRKQIDVERRQALAVMRTVLIAAGLNPNDPEAGGIATIDQIAGLPCVAPQKLIRDGSETYRSRAPRCGPCRVIPFPVEHSFQPSA
jgi:hypothetical protein